MFSPFKRITSSLLRSLSTRLLYFKSSSTQENKLRVEVPESSTQKNYAYQSHYPNDNVNIKKNSPSQDMTIHDAKHFIDPNLQDNFLLDLNETLMYRKVSKEFGIPYLSTATETYKFPIQGRLWGPNKRPIVNIICSYKDRGINIFFIVDTGCPYSYISSNAFKALGAIDDTPSFILINGEESYVLESHSHFADCCVLGADYFSDQKLILECNYASKRVTIKRGFRYGQFS